MAPSTSLSLSSSPRGSGGSGECGHVGAAVRQREGEEREGERIRWAAQLHGRRGEGQDRAQGGSSSER